LSWAAPGWAALAGAAQPARGNLEGVPGHV